MPGEVARAGNSSYLGGRDWENHGLGQPRQKVSETPPPFN
jgi:hypothetical protein